MKAVFRGVPEWVQKLAYRPETLSEWHGYIDGLFDPFEVDEPPPQIINMPHLDVKTWVYALVGIGAQVGMRDGWALYGYAGERDDRIWAAESDTRAYSKREER